VCRVFDSPRGHESAGQVGCSYAGRVLDDGHAREIADRYSLGDGASLSGPVARGELGQVWQLATSLGLYAPPSRSPVLTARVRYQSLTEEGRVRGAGQRARFGQGASLFTAAPISC
jgi:hypothetical protein